APGAPPRPSEDSTRGLAALASALRVVEEATRLSDEARGALAHVEDVLGGLHGAANVVDSDDEDESSSLHPPASRGSSPTLPALLTPQELSALRERAEKSAERLNACAASTAAALPYSSLELARSAAWGSTRADPGGYVSDDEEFEPRAGAAALRSAVRRRLSRLERATESWVHDRVVP
ncbi:hypothetical protein H632_c5319p0, partial [Helicosporidium sp. ATCC 50920]